ncbi:MAG: hypothetical protein JXA71_08320, partial [Chitinispirillaceae bacterium]|nr:hypothetical protein [Chitinispirillaceae bacterium]
MHVSHKSTSRPFPVRRLSFSRYFLVIVLIPSLLSARTVIWTGAGGDNKWRTNGNWDIGSSPANTDDVIFNDGSVDAYLDHVFLCVCQSITMTSGYTGNFSFNGNTLAVGRDADFSTGGTITATGTLQLNGEAAATFTPSATQQLPSIVKQGNFTMTVTGAGLNAVGLSITAGTGTWHWGTEGLTHAVDTILASSGSMDFGNARVQVTAGNASFAGMTAITAGTGILEFTHAANTQILTPLNAVQTHPAIVHSGDGMLQLAASNLVTDSVHNSAGLIDFNSRNVTTIGNFTIVNGTSSTIFDAAGTNSLGGRTITVGGNATLEGQAGNLLNLDAGSTWYLSTTGALEARYARLQNCDATGGSRGILTKGLDISGNINWVRTTVWIGLGADNNWNTPGNWSGGVVPGATDTLMLFDETSIKTCVLDVSPTILRVRFEPGYTGDFDFNGNVLTVTWHADFRSGGDFIPNGGRIDLAWPSTQFLYPPTDDTLPAIRKTGAGTVIVSENPLTSVSVTSTAGTWDWGDEGLSHSIGSLTGSAGTMDFGSGSVAVTDGDADLSGLASVTTGAGSLHFTAANPTTQVLTPAPSGTHPAV